MVLVIVKIFIFISLFVSCVALFHGLKQKNVVKNIYTQFTETLDEISLERAKEEKKNIRRAKTQESFLEKLMDKPRKNFVYSRLGYSIPGLTVEWWLIINLLLTAVIYFAVFLITKRMILSLFAPAFYLAVVLAIQKVMIYRNYRTVERQLLHFVNQMENFRMASGSVTGVFHKVSKHVEEPLRSVLEECYYEAQTSGDISEALYALADKIEHPKFKSFIHNIEACIRYTGNYKSVVESGRNDILKEQSARVDRRHIIGSAVSLVCICISSGLVLWSIMGNIIGVPLVDIIRSPLGNIGLAMLAVVLVMFAFSIAKAVR